MEQKNEKSGVSRNKVLQVIASILVAVAIWVYVDVEKAPERTKTIRDIPVEFSGESTTLADKNLMLLSGYDTTVDLTIKGTKRELVEFMMERYDGIVVESFGVGGLPEYPGEEFYPLVQRAVEQGKIVVMTTQVPNEGSDLSVYHVGGHLKNTLHLLEAFDMTTEAICGKLMWILGQTRDPEQINRLFYTPVANDILHYVHR